MVLGSRIWFLSKLTWKFITNSSLLFVLCGLDIVINFIIMFSFHLVGNESYSFYFDGGFNWIIRRHSKFQVWLDNWIGVSIFNFLDFDRQVWDLDIIVGNFIDLDGKWSLSYKFVTSFMALSEVIKEFLISIDSSDMLVWKDSLLGSFSCKSFLFYASGFESALGLDYVYLGYFHSSFPFDFGLENFYRSDSNG